MDRLVGPIRPYAWGSRTAIAAVQGRPIPAPGPEAELWLGAHPADPAMVVRDGTSRSLIRVIAADPPGTLGEPVVSEFGPRLPYLMKFLAADEPLSLQVHPDADQARAGFDAEESAGVPADAPHRNYVDPNHKPELLCAVTEFEGLCGFRDLTATVPLLTRLAAPLLGPVLDHLRAGRLREAVTRLLTMPGPERRDLVDEVVAACERLAGAVPEYALAADLGSRYPGDVGVVVALLLNLVLLEPGTAVSMPPGTPHAYVRGVGVEIMAASDNVLRGGLTVKHVDVPELLRVIRFEVAPPPIVHGERVAPGVFAYRTPAPEFLLSRVVVGGANPRVEVPGTGPRILFCLYGRVVTDDGIDEVTLGAGEAAFVPAAKPPMTLTGFGELYQGGVR